MHEQEGETLVGFAPDGSFLVLESAGGKNALKRFIGSNPKEQTLVDDIAPGALFVHSDNIYVAPDGHAVVVVGDSADGNDRAWYTALDGTASAHELASATSGQMLVFAGWNKLTSLN